MFQLHFILKRIRLFLHNVGRTIYLASAGGKTSVAMELSRDENLGTTVNSGESSSPLESDVTPTSNVHFAQCVLVPPSCLLSTISPLGQTS